LGEEKLLGMIRISEFGVAATTDRFEPVNLFLRVGESKMTDFIAILLHLCSTADVIVPKGPTPSHTKQWLDLFCSDMFPVQYNFFFSGTGKFFSQSFFRDR
jgi:hypothetical protein